jgi:pilus assembly protein TadC
MVTGLWLDLLLFGLLLAVLLLIYRANSGDESLASGQSWRERIAGYYPRLARQAGFDPARFSWVYWLSKLFLAVVLPLLVLEVWAAPLPSIVVLAVLGFLLPDLWLARARRRRRRRIRGALSYFLDLLVALLHSGLSLEEAFRRAGRGGLEEGHPLAEEVALVAVELDVGKDRAPAFQALAERTGVSELKGVAAALSSGVRYGVGLEATLEAQASLLRARQREGVRKQINTAMVRSLLPLFLCGYPVFVVLVLFPAMIEMFRAFGALAEIF